MQRRKFLRLFGAVTGGCAGGFITRNIVADRLKPASEGNTCSPAARFVPELRRDDAVLSYQGTHNLTEGALKDVGRAYQGATGQPIRIVGGGCDDGLAVVRQERAHLGGVCCPLEEEDHADGPLESVTVAREWLAVIVHPSNPAAGLSMDALRAVARGKVHSWRRFGGEDRAIAQVIRRHCPQHREPVRDALLENNDAWPPEALEVHDELAVCDTVARFQGALGIVSWVFAAPYVRRGQLKVLALENRRPGESAAMEGDYPLQGPLSVVYKDWDETLMAPFFDFLFAPEGQEIISRRLLPVTREESGLTRT